MGGAIATSKTLGNMLNPTVTDPFTLEPIHLTDIYG